jgi:hypothetical protein
MSIRRGRFRFLRHWHPLWWLPWAVILMLVWVEGTMPW